MKKSLWDMILKVVIAVASAVAGVLGTDDDSEIGADDIARAYDSSDENTF